MMDLSMLTIGGAPWLNLLNTVYRSQQHDVDLLENASALREWLIRNELIPSDEWPSIEPDKSKLVAKLARLRDICRTLLRECKQRNGIGREAVQPLQEWLQRIPLQMELNLEDGCLIERYRATDRLDDIVYRIAVSAIHTLQSLPLERIRQCEHADCILHFADTSKAGRRRWCSMETCGNRHKAAEFYARKKQNR